MSKKDYVIFIKYMGRLDGYVKQNVPDTGLSDFTKDIQKAKLFTCRQAVNWVRRLNELNSIKSQIWGYERITQ